MRYLGILLAALLLWAAAGCGGGGTVTDNMDDNPVSRWAIDPGKTISSGFNDVYPITAGQNIEVGDVYVSVDADFIYVKYVIDADDWWLTEAHLDIFPAVEGGSNDPFPEGYKPIPGQMPVSETGLMTKEVTLEFPLDPTWDWYSTELVFVPHCVVIKAIGGGGPSDYQWATTVLDSAQGTMSDGFTPITWKRSNTDSILGPPNAPAPTEPSPPGPGYEIFYSLGFDTDRTDTEYETGWVDVGYDYRIYNHPEVDDDVIAVEVTWGSYPYEYADIYAYDGSEYVFCGSVNNGGGGGATLTVPIPDDLDCIEYVRIVDHTDPALFGSGGDGYDLNAVGVKWLCTQDETGFGGDEDGPGKRWFKYFTWKLHKPVPDFAVNFTPYNPYGTTSYWKIDFTGNGGWADDFPYIMDPAVGWCVDRDHTMNPGGNYSAYIWDSLDPDQPWKPLADWDKLNWVLNENRLGTLAAKVEAIHGGTFAYTYKDVQNVFWYYMGYGMGSGPGTDAWQATVEGYIVEVADLYGTGYVPSPGEWFAFILYTTTTAQINIIEVDP